MRPIEAFCCQNKECSEYGKRGAGNLRQHGWSGHGKRVRLFYCRGCHAYFSERKGTALEHSHLPQDKALAVLAHVAEGCGVRQTARLAHVDKNTVYRLARVAGGHARLAHDELVALSPSNGRDPVRREVGVRLPEGKAVRSGRSR